MIGTKISLIAILGLLTAVSTAEAVTGGEAAGIAVGTGVAGLAGGTALGALQSEKILAASQSAMAKAQALGASVSEAADSAVLKAKNALGMASKAEEVADVAKVAEDA